jgi:hypothetical protein
MPKMAFGGRKSSQTLAAVESLDCLLYPAVPVYVLMRYCTRRR